MLGIGLPLFASFDLGDEEFCRRAITLGGHGSLIGTCDFLERDGDSEVLYSKTLHLSGCGHLQRAKQMIIAQESLTPASAQP